MSAKLFIQSAVALSHSKGEMPQLRGNVRLCVPSGVCTLKLMMVWSFPSLSIFLKSNRDNGRVIMKGSVL